MSAAFWDQFAPTELERAENNPEDVIYQRQVSAFLAGVMTREDRVLDIGGGPGRFSLPLASVVASVDHIDLSPRMLEAAAARAGERGLTNIRFSLGDARDLSGYGDRSFSKVLSINAPITFAATEWRLAFDEMCRVAAGEAIFTVANFISCASVLINASVLAGAGWGKLVSTMAAEHLMLGEELAKLGHVWPSYRAFAPGELEPEIERQGFEIVAVRGLAVLCRLMTPEAVRAIVEDEAQARAFIELDDQIAAQYGRWAPSRELLFHIRRRS